MSPRRGVALVAEREIRERLRGRAFRASTAVMLLAVVGIMVFTSVTADGGPEDVTVAVAGAEATGAAEAARDLQGGFDVRVEVTQADDPAAARAAVVAEEADAALTGEGIAVAGSAPDRLAVLLQEASRRVRAVETLRDAGLTREQASAALSAPTVSVERVGEAGEDAAVLSFLVTLLLYVGIFTFGYYVSSGVVEEKSSRVVEIVLSTIRPVTLLAGKVIGIGLLGLVQLAAIAAAGLGAALLLDQVEVPNAAATTILLAFAYFILGYAFYASAFAVAGAIVARQEDLQSTTAPISVLLIGSYLAVLPVIESPDSTLARITTLLPPSAPMTVPARAAQGALPAGELALSLALMVVGTALMLLGAARIYERSILRLGAPLKLRQALRLPSS